MKTVSISEIEPVAETIRCGSAASRSRVSSLSAWGCALRMTQTSCSWNSTQRSNRSDDRPKAPMAMSTRPESSASVTLFSWWRRTSSARGARSRNVRTSPGASTADR